MSAADETQPAPAAPPTGGDDLVGKLIAGKYEVLGAVARGGMARIYRAEQIPLGRTVALKVLTPPRDSHDDPNFQARFFLEASTCAKLKHPNTVKVYDYGQQPDDGSFYMVMEFVEGRTLHDVIRSEGALEPARALRIASEIARSLQEAHAHDIVHRDLKPSNVMLVESIDGEQVKVLDFGVAKVLRADDNLTLDDRIVGSPRYMSPEQIRNNGDLDARTDLYSLGIVMYEMLTGRAPFTNDHAMQILVAHLQDPVPPLGSRAAWPVPPRLSALVHRCLEKDPAARPADVAEFRQLLKQALAELGDSPTDSRIRTDSLLRSLGTVGAESNPTLDPPPRSRRVAPGVWVALAVIPLLLLGSGALAVLALVLGWNRAGPGPTPRPPVEVAAPAVVPPPGPSAPAPPATTPLRIVSEPPGAEVWEGTLRLGVTPLELVLAADDPPRTFEVRRSGYVTARVEPVWSAAPVEARVELDRAARATPRPKPVPRSVPDDDIRIER